MIADGAYGPGLAAWCDGDAARLTTVLNGVLLLIAGQLAWLIRWARSRSLRDFRGRYRVWWWASLALVCGGVAVLTDAHRAFAMTVVWLTGETPFGSDLLFRVLPAIIATVVLLPAVQADMRNCRTSRTFFLLAVMFWITAGTAAFFPGEVSTVLASTHWPIPVAAATTGCWLLGTVTLFAALLIHARHVIYESVEPPDLPARRKKPAKASTGESASSDPEPKQTPRRSSRTKSATKATEKSAESSSKKTVPAAKVAAKATGESKAQSTRSDANSTPAPAAAKSSATEPGSTPESDAWTDGSDDGRTDRNGRRHRLDEPHDALKGLSKRERRKQRKLMRDRERAEQ